MATWSKASLHRNAQSVSYFPRTLSISNSKGRMNFAPFNYYIKKIWSHWYEGGYNAFQKAAEWGQSQNDLDFEVKAALSVASKTSGGKVVRSLRVNS